MNKMADIADVVAICSGQTLLSTSNLYQDQFASMVATNNCVKHAVLSLTSSYVLDFHKDDRMIDRANLLQRQVIELIGRALNDPETYTSGKEDAMPAAIAILAHNEVGSII
jgi:hypothetical protein